MPEPLPVRVPEFRKFIVVDEDENQHTHFAHGLDIDASGTLSFVEIGAISAEGGATARYVKIYGPGVWLTIEEELLPTPSLLLQ